MTIKITNILGTKLTKQLTTLMMISAMSTSVSMASDDDLAAAEIHNTGVSLIDAIQAAQSNTQGVAFEAELENENGVWLFEVETISSSNLIWKSYIDVNSGAVVRRKIDDSFEHTVNAVRGVLQNLSLEDAIASVEAQFGGKAYEADLDREDGRWVFEVEVANTSGPQTEAYVDAATGNTTQSSSHGTSDDGDDQNDVNVVDIYELPITLSEAIATAESASGGRAYDAELDAVNGRWFYEVEVVLQNGARRELRINVYTGIVFRDRVDSDSFNLIDNRDIRNMSRAQIRGAVTRTRALCRRASTSAAVRACLRRHKL